MAKFNITLHISLDVDDKYIEDWNRGQERFAELIGNPGVYTPFPDATAQDYCDHIENIIYERGDTGTVTYEIK